MQGSDVFAAALENAKNENAKAALNAALANAANENAHKSAPNPTSDVFAAA
jgi:hypothetical protein